MMKIALITLFIASMLSIGISAAQDDEAKAILETAAEAGNFNTLLGAIEAAGLAETLNGEGPFTVFAPTDEAFAAVEGLDAMDAETLENILKYHVASGAITAEELSTMTTIPSLQGESLTVEVTDEGVEVGGAKVTATIVCSNGVIHVIDTVLNPPEEEAADELVEDISTTSSQDDFLDQPVDEELIDTALSTTSSQDEFLDQPVSSSLIDTNLDITSSMWLFLFDEPITEEAPFYTKGQMMGGEASDLEGEGEGEPSSSFYTKGRMMGT